MKVRNKGNKWDNKYPMWFLLPCWKDFYFLDIDMGKSLKYMLEILQAGLVS